MGNSLIVQGKTIQLAMERASVLLHCPLNQVRYEILHDANKNKSTRDPQVYKLKVHASDSPVPEESSNNIGCDTFNLPEPPAGIMSMSKERFLAALDSVTEQVLNMSDEPKDSPFNLTRAYPSATAELTVDHLHSGHDFPFDSNLVIHGTVNGNQKITVAGNIEIHGDIENCTVVCGGDLTVHGSVYGTIESEYGHVTCACVQGGAIYANNGSVTILRSAVNSNVYARQNVTVEGSFVSGECYGEGGMVLNSAGSPSQAPCLLVSGANRRLQTQIENIRTEVAAIVDILGRYRTARDSMVEAERRGSTGFAEQRPCLWESTAKCAAYTHRILILANKKRDILGMINHDRGSKICVSDIIYPKVKILIDDCPTEISAITKYSSFSKDYDAGRLRVASFT